MDTNDFIMVNKGALTEQVIGQLLRSIKPNNILIYALTTSNLHPIAEAMLM